MYGTELSTFLLAGGLVITLAIAVAALIFARKAAEYSRECSAYVDTENKNAVSLRKIAELESTLTELLDSYYALLTSHKKLRSRIGMREVREKRGNGVNSSSAPPDSEAGRAEFKSRLRLQCKERGLLK